MAAAQGHDDGINIYESKIKNKKSTTTAEVVEKLFIIVKIKYCNKKTRNCPRKATQYCV